jgi:hypothetical protein
MVNPLPTDVENGPHTPTDERLEDPTSLAQDVTSYPLSHSFSIPVKGEINSNGDDQNTIVVKEDLPSQKDIVYVSSIAH